MTMTLDVELLHPLQGVDTEILNMRKGLLNLTAALHEEPRPI